MKKHLIIEKSEGYPNLDWAEFLPPGAFLDFFCKISTPVINSFDFGTNIRIVSKKAYATIPPS